MLTFLGHVDVLFYMHSEDYVYNDTCVYEYTLQLRLIYNV